MDIGPFNNSDPWRRTSPGKQDETGQTVTGRSMFRSLLGAMAESPARYDVDVLRYNSSGSGDAFAKAFSEMPIVAPVACNNSEQKPRETIRATTSRSMAAGEQTRPVGKQAGSIEAIIGQAFRVPGERMDIAVECVNMAHARTGERNLLFSRGSNTTVLPSIPANAVTFSSAKLPGAIKATPSSPSAHLSPSFVRLLPTDNGIRVSVRLGKLDASENAQLRVRISTVAREFGQPLAGLSIITSRRG